MNCERALHLNTAALAVIGALFLGLGHESVVLPLALGLAAAISVWLGTRLPWLRLNRVLANLVALAAVIWSMRNFLQIGSEGQLLAISDMLVYLQIVLFFQEKTARVYWQLIVLSLLQVVVAAALNLGPEFGILLTAYMALAISALVLLCRHHEWQKIARQEKRSGAMERANWQSLLAEPSVNHSSQTLAAMGTAKPGPITWPSALLAAATLVFAGAFFYATPRLRDGTWSDHRDDSATSTGFAVEAVLEESGRIHQSNQLVMRVVLTSALDRRSYPLVSEPYYQGVVLTEYLSDGSRGRWIPGKPPRVSSKLPLTPPKFSALPLANLVREDIMLEGGAPQAFAIFPIFNVQEMASGIQVLPQRASLARPGQLGDSRSSREFRYAVATTGLRNGRQLRAYPHRNPKLTEFDDLPLRLEKEALLKFDRQRFPGLAAVADEVVQRDGADKQGTLEQALALERHFHVPGQYHYSLILDFPRDKQLDPIEDFVVNHRTGHCEYFASALVMMLRSRGIPARMIVGYKGGDYNPIGDYYQVRQRHSHAWVEAYLPPEATPIWELAGTASGGGSWYRLDPTPSSFEMTVDDTAEGPLGRVIQTFDYVELLWRDYVLSLNADKQHDAIYDPVGNRAFAWLPAWLDPKSADRLVRRLARRLGLGEDVGGSDETIGARVLHLRSGSALLVLLVLAVVVVQALIRGIQLARWKWHSGNRARRGVRGGPPRFYRRLVSLLSRLRLCRATGQTARELAASAADRLSDYGQPAGIARLPDEVVAAYYRVRFGGASLDSHELAGIEQALAQLAPVVNQAKA